jgi:hypothetical protein
VISASALAQLKADNPCDAVAERLGVRLRRRGGRIVGPCPICSTNKQSSRSTKFEIKNGGETWVCVNCGGGDVIKLIELAEGQDFLGAVAWLGGPGEVDQAAAEKRARVRAEQQKKREAEAERYHQTERKGLHGVWTHAVKELWGTPVEGYLKVRGLELPPDVRLRYVPALPFYHGTKIGEDGGKRARIIHCGGGMVAPITDNAGVFRGLSQTWIDLNQSRGRPVLIDPDTGEPLKARKFRGSTRAGHIDLLGPRLPSRIIVGEGVETVLTAWLALMKLGRDLADTAFWTALDLGNFGGRAADKVGRIPGPTPDLETPAITLPPCVADVVLLGDSDSERTLTECALRRAAARWTTPARTVRVAWAPPGGDFNDLLTEPHPCRDAPLLEEVATS